MKTKTNLIIALAFLVFAFSACSFNTSPPGINSLNFGKNDKATPPTTEFNVGERVYAVAIAGASAGQKVRFNLTTENVQGKK